MQQFPWRLLAPQHWPIWIGVGIAWLLAHLPYRAQMAIGAGIGRLLYRVATERRRVVAVNIGLCFPELDDPARARLVHQNFLETGRGILDMLNTWFRSDAAFQRLVTIDGLDHVRDALSRGKGVIVLSAHMSAFQVGLRAISGHGTLSAVFRLRSDPVLNFLMVRISSRWLRGRLIDSADMPNMLGALKAGHLLFYAPDQHPLTKFRVAAPFFGRMTMTHAGTTGVARMTGAAVLPFFTYRRSDAPGYRIEILPVLDAFPSADKLADSVRVNQVIETAIRKAPEQYFWLHERFKRLADGEVWRNAYTLKIVGKKGPG
jgi:Kdo2-lipid IVA lauroyltransferase/acyltransferase